MRTRSLPHVTEFAKSHHAEGKAEGLAEGKAEGLAQGKAEDVLTVLATRGLKVTPGQQARIRQSTDLAQLDEWLRRAVTASSADEIFA